MQYAEDSASPAMLQPPFCCECKHYEPAPENRPDVDPQCRRGVTYGRHAVPTPSIVTMRDPHWWGNVGCGPDAQYWEPAP